MRSSRPRTTSSWARGAGRPAGAVAADSIEELLDATTSRRDPSFELRGQCDRRLGALVGVVGTDALPKEPLELTRRLELLHDVSAADELALDEDLRDGRPAGDGGEILADLRVGEDVDGGHRRTGAAERLECTVGVAAHHEL